ncbi:transposase [Paenibacillus sp. WQ 127069]|uniref:Transposase n=1 Tax=Paenibacillus baimaensis TaxID=2982185 RepID=A0ABT2UH85_9BACL|nr:transposase [Paenibacillus sp. WQ 127069]
MIKEIPYDELKILHWDQMGFWLCYRRLLRGTFGWPADGTTPLHLTYRELRWLLDSLSLTQQRRIPAFRRKWRFNDSLQERARILSNLSTIRIKPESLTIE